VEFHQRTSVARLPTAWVPCCRCAPSPFCWVAYHLLSAWRPGTSSAHGGWLRCALESIGSQHALTALRLNGLVPSTGTFPDSRRSRLPLPLGSLPCGDPGIVFFSFREGFFCFLRFWVRARCVVLGWFLFGSKSSRFLWVVLCWVSSVGTVFSFLFGSRVGSAPLVGVACVCGGGVMLLRVARIEESPGTFFSEGGECGHAAADHTAARRLMRLQGIRSLGSWICTGTHVFCFLRGLRAFLCFIGIVRRQ
jgi:hypothetical protein